MDVLMTSAELSRVMLQSTEDNPFVNINKCHDWRNYIVEPVRANWPKYPVQFKQIMAVNAQILADKEEWN